jgi:hypothetical protein
MFAAASLSFSTAALAGSARDYLNAPVDAWLVNYNSGYSTSITPEDGTDISFRTRSNVFLQSLVLTPASKRECNEAEPNSRTQSQSSPSRRKRWNGRTWNVEPS